MIKPIEVINMFPSFITSALVAYYQALEAIKESGWKGVLHPRFFSRRKATPVVMDLTPLASLPNVFQKPNYHFAELKMQDLMEGRLVFLSPGRGIKAIRNLKKGWRGFVLTQANQVIGDIWCVDASEKGGRVGHSDLVMLGIRCENKDAYAFDMYIVHDHRGENLAVPFHRSLHATLKAEGYRKVYGYYWDDNLPALWMHRMLRFKELPKREVSRFLLYEKAESLDNHNTSADSARRVIAESADGKASLLDQHRGESAIQPVHPEKEITNYEHK